MEMNAAVGDSYIIFSEPHDNSSIALCASVQAEEAVVAAVSKTGHGQEVGLGLGMAAGGWGRSLEGL